MRPRRLASYVLDVLLVFAPWWAMLGLVVSPPGGGGMAGIGLAVVLAGMCGLATLGLLVLEVVVFAVRGRTLGMGCVGIAATGGSRGLALLLGVLVLVLPAGAAFLVSSHMSGDMQLLLETTVPLGAIGLDLCFALAPGGRTLTDRIAGIRWQRDVGPSPRSGGALAVDALVGAMLGFPTLLVFDWDDAAGAVVASAVVVGLFGLLEAAVAAATRGTLGMRTLARPPQA